MQLVWLKMALNDDGWFPNACCVNIYLFSNGQHYLDHHSDFRDYNPGTYSMAQFVTPTISTGLRL